MNLIILVYFVEQMRNGKYSVGNGQNFEARRYCNFERRCGYGGEDPEHHWETELEQQNCGSWRGSPSHRKDCMGSKAVLDGPSCCYRSTGIKNILITGRIDFFFSLNPVLRVLPQWINLFTQIKSWFILFSQRVSDVLFVHISLCGVLGFWEGWLVAVCGCCGVWWGFVGIGVWCFKGKKKCFGWGLVEVWELFMTANIIITFFLFNKTSN